MNRKLLLQLAALATAVRGAILAKTDLAVSYDFVIVGGGTAGLVLANRLTEIPTWSVLIIEAGANHDDDLNVQVPYFADRLFPHTALDWNFTTVPQASLGGRVLNVPRGHALGGSSVINHLAYIRGSAEDYNYFADVTGDPGWSWTKLLPYFFKNEKLIQAADAVDHLDHSIHGHGILADSLSSWPIPPDSRVLAASQQLKDDFPFNKDLVNGYTLGLSWALRTIGNGTRSTSSNSYLAPKYRNRPNLHILTETRVTRLLQTRGGGDHDQTNSNGTPMIRTVEFASNADAPRHTVTATKEVILAAGAVGTPHILLHSGIGDSHLLNSLAIPVVLHSPSVGANVSDHPSVGLSYLVNETDTFETLTRNETLLNQYLDQWKASRTGPLTNTIGNQWGYFRVPNSSTIWKTHQRDPASGPNTPHFEVLVYNGLVGNTDPPPGNFMGVGIAVVSPSSRGSLMINSTNPFDPPLIDPRIFSEDIDVKVLREGVKFAQKLVGAPAWDNYIVAPFATNATSDEDIEAFIHAKGGSAQHISGTAAMSARGAPYGVVNPDLKVKGISGLRIVDASVFPKVPAAHTQVPVYVFAERASDLVKASWK